MPNVTLSMETILLALACMVILAGVVSSLNKGRKDWHELSGQAARDAETNEIKSRVSTLEEKTKSIESRLDAGEKNFATISKDTGQIMNVLDGLLMHFISGNDRDKLRTVKSELDTYKNERMRGEIE